jgi:hypothetical protein
MRLVTCLLMCFMAGDLLAQGSDGLGMGLGNLPWLSNAKTRSISPENFAGEKGKGGMATEGTGKNAARDLGQGWKISPSVGIEPNQTFVMADVKAEGAIQHIWMTPTGNNRFNILRMYWDGEKDPSVECPAGDFFACGLGEYAPVTSLAVCVNPKSGFNCYWTMPFRKGFRITMTNIDTTPMVLYYQIDYILAKVPKNVGRFHAQFRRTNPTADEQDYTILDGVRGQGHYVGTYMTWGSNTPGWWGEGEIKFYLDGDKEFPTICGTGTEDYFCGSYGFEKFQGQGYQTFSGPYTGMPQVIESAKQPRFGLYRWHIMDPVRFEQNLRVTIQALGWQSEGRYLPLQDDLSSVAYWYQKEPHAPFPSLPDKAALRIKKK